MELKVMPISLLKPHEDVDLKILEDLVKALKQTVF